MCKYTHVYILICVHYHVCAHMCEVNVLCLATNVVMPVSACVHFSSGEPVDITVGCVSMCFGTCVHV